MGFLLIKLAIFLKNDEGGKKVEGDWYFYLVLGRGYIVSSSWEGVCQFILGYYLTQ